MIRVRCETGLPGRYLGRRPGPERIDIVLHCAYLQAMSIANLGQKIVPLAALARLNWSQTTLSLCNLGVLDLRTWQESLKGNITRVRQVDLSVASAHMLMHFKLLPRYFLPYLISHDLLGGDIVADPVAEAEFLSWIECGGLGKDLIGQDPSPSSVGEESQQMPVRTRQFMVRSDLQSAAI